MKPIYAHERKTVQKRIVLKRTIPVSFRTVLKNDPETSDRYKQGFRWSASYSRHNGRHGVTYFGVTKEEAFERLIKDYNKVANEVLDKHLPLDVNK